MSCFGSTIVSAIRFATSLRIHGQVCDICTRKPNRPSVNRWVTLYGKPRKYFGRYSRAVKRLYRSPVVHVPKQAAREDSEPKVSADQGPVVSCDSLHVQCPSLVCYGVYDWMIPGSDTTARTSASDVLHNVTWKLGRVVCVV